MNKSHVKSPSCSQGGLAWLRDHPCVRPQARPAGRRRWVDYAFLAAFFLLLLLAASMSDVFFTQRNISNLLRQIVTNGLISLGMLVVILTGGIDLSVGPVVAFAAIVVSGMVETPGPAAAGGHRDRPVRGHAGGSSSTAS